MHDLLSIERHRRIVDLLARHRVVRVGQLARDFDVAEETVRRDLNALDRRGLLMRTRGGAIEPQVSQGKRAEALTADTSFEQRRREKLAEKKAIADLAVEMIQPGMTVALDGSTTAVCVAEKLGETPVTVVTNSVVVAGLLAGRAGVQVICTGGVLDAELKMMTGMLAIESLGQLNVDVAFFSCRGVDVVRGYSDPTDAGALFKQALIKRARHSVLLADSSKFDLQAAVMIAPVRGVKEMITDSGAGSGNVGALRRNGVRVSVAKMTSPRAKGGRR